MEATAMSLGKAVLGGALSYAKSQAAEEVALQLGVEDDVIFISDELQMMQSFLMTADEERSQSKVLTTWVTLVRDLAYNVDDSLMDFDLHAGKKPIWGYIPRNLCDRRRIAKEVKKLRAKVEDVSNYQYKKHF
ncbi:disease resistance protein Pik-2-like [Miscanthus floridulus]|uniref:disease resistance protein Pik-2-like n=1 Tax=Miscanthus floridulus TaxID=154761 RepID=UPI00345890DF